ncbi:hypothetical protein Tco_0146382 [Tanacetum coccineum]
MSRWWFSRRYERQMIIALQLKSLRSVTELTTDRLKHWISKQSSSCLLSEEALKLRRISLELGKTLLVDASENETTEFFEKSE